MKTVKYKAKSLTEVIELIIKDHEWRVIWLILLLHLRYQVRNNNSLINKMISHLQHLDAKDLEATWKSFNICFKLMKTHRVNLQGHLLNQRIF